MLIKKVNEKTGYIRLATFTNDAGKEVKDALNELKKNSALNSVILDVRGNPGGLLNEAVNIVKNIMQNSPNATIDQVIRTALQSRG